MTAVKRDLNALCVQIRLEGHGRGSSRQHPNILRLRISRIRATEDGFVMEAAGTVSGSMGRPCFALGPSGVQCGCVEKILQKLQMIPSDHETAQ